jgi:hypothetical protein
VFKLAIALSTVAYLLALFTYSVVRWNYPRVGFEGQVFAAMSSVLAVLSAVIGIVLSLVIVIRRKDKWALCTLLGCVVAVVVCLLAVR